MIELVFYLVDHFFLNLRNWHFKKIPLVSPNYEIIIAVFQNTLNYERQVGFLELLLP